MSRVANSPIELPAGVDLTQTGQQITVKGSQGSLSMTVHKSVEVSKQGNVLTFKAKDEETESNALAGTTRALINNMVIGVSKGFEKKLLLNGVGYRAKSAGTTLNLTLGFSHPIDYILPEGVHVETPTQTEILVKGLDKQLVGQVAAEIRAYRPPEPYKGKGVRYANETVLRKDAKKK